MSMNVTHSADANWNSWRVVSQNAVLASGDGRSLAQEALHTPDMAEKGAPHPQLLPIDSNEVRS